MKKGIDAFASKVGFTKKDSVAYKKVKDYMVTISLTTTANLRCCISIDDLTLNDLDKRAITRFINKNYEKYKINKFRWDESGIDVTFQKLGSQLYECFTAFVMDVTTELQKVNCKGLQACTICGRPNDGSSALFYLYGFICGIHKDCMNKYDEETNVTKVNTKKYDRGNVLSGIFGALWGAVVGSLLLLIGLAFFSQDNIREWLFVLAFLIPIAVKFYYEVFDGKNKFTTKFVVVAIMSILATVTAVAAGNAIYGYSSTREFVFDWMHKETYPAVGVCVVVLLLLNYTTVKIRGTKQAYKVD